MKEHKEKTQEPVVPVKLRSERRAAQIASTRIAESAKLLASNRISATDKSPSTAKARSNAPKSPKGKAKAAANAKQPPVLLPKMPVLVFNPSTGVTSPMKTFIPATSIGTPVSAPRSLTVNVSSLKKNDASKVLHTTPVKRKSAGNSNSISKQTNLVMECEDDALTPIQWATYKKSENEYLEVLRKLSKWKSSPEVEIVRLEADDPIPPVPVFLSVTEAAKLPLPDNLANTENVATNSLSAVSKQALTAIQTPKGTVVSAGHAKLLIRSTAGTSAQASVASKTQLGDSKKSSGPTTTGCLPSSILYKQKSLFFRYPELCIKLVPQKSLPLQVLSFKKTELDAIFKTLSSSGRLALEKWMLEKGLFGATRYCLFHSNVQMKLMYMSCLNDKLRKSGYKWWCPNCAVMVPVTQGSFFSKWKNTHHEILRLIYHWSCNTDIQTVIQEYVYNGELISSVYTALRSICNAQSLQWRLGGPSHSVEVAWLQIGNCQDFGDISVFCAYDRNTRLVILGAAATCAVKTKLSVLLRTLVTKDSTIVGDRQLFPYLPPHFKSSFVSSPSTGTCAHQNAASYLRDQVALGLKGQIIRLKLQTIQAILDELSWREKFGQSSHDAFNNIILHIRQAYVCSVVTTKSVNSLPITMSCGMKVVDTDEQNNISISTEQVLSKAVPVVSSKLSQESMEISTESEPPLIDVDEDESSRGFPSADVIIEEFPQMELNAKTGHMEEVVTMDSDNEEAKSSNMAVFIKGVGENVMIMQSEDGNLKISCPEKEITEKLGDVPLDWYYYANIVGSEEINKQQIKAKFKFKCPACKKVIEDNVKIMKHLYGHIDDLKQLNLDLSDLTQCKFCFREFESPYAMQSHVDEVHIPEPLSPVCRICDKEFAKKDTLLRHMQMLHSPSEMPYKCLICKFRTSFYRDIIDHFHQVHDRTDKLLCRYCLKVFTVRFNNIGIQEGVTIGFYRHLYKHQTKSTSRRCQFCCLTFLNVAELQQHRINDHTSFKNIKGVNPVETVHTERTIFINPDHMKKAQTTSNKVFFGINKPRIVEAELIEAEMKCIECKMSLFKPNHFMQTTACSLCFYMTSCNRAFTDHAIQIHSIPPRIIPKPFRCLDYSVHCLCGFYTFQGDEMARHLSKCIRTWCYFEDLDESFTTCSDEDICFKKPLVPVERQKQSDATAEEPMEVSQPSESASSDNDDKHNMLNILGLMRVPSLKRSAKKYERTKASDVKESDSDAPMEITS